MPATTQMKPEKPEGTSKTTKDWFSLQTLTTLLVLVFTLVLTTGFGTLLYFKQKEQTIHSLNQRLLLAAGMAHQTIPANYHDRISNQESIPPSEYKAIVQKFDQLCLAHGLEFIWSVIEIDGIAYFSTGTSTDKKNHSGGATFLAKHSNQKHYSQAFARMETDFRTITDKWGNLRTVLVPHFDTAGRKYLFGACIRLDQLATAKQTVLYESLLLGLTCMVLFSMLGLFLVRHLLRPVKDLTRSALKISSGHLGTTVKPSRISDLKLLGEQFNHMSRQIKENLDQLELSREDLKITLDSIGDGVISTDINTNIVRMNKVAEDLTGWTIDAARGKPINEIFRIYSAITGEPCENPVEKVIEKGTIVGLANHTNLLARDGAKRQIADSGAPIRTANGEITGVVLVFRDVTEEYAIQQQLQQNRKMDAIGRLAGGVAHDFNNMLGGILGAVELLEPDLSSRPKEGKLLALIKKAAENASDLTTKLLAFGRKGPILPAPTDIHDAIRDGLAILERSIDRRITIQTDLKARSSLITGSISLFENVVLNLGLNAAEAMPDGGDLTVTTNNLQLDETYCANSHFPLTPGNFIEIEVRDTGTGIPPELLGNVFEPFFSTKSTQKSTGLGLASVYGTIQQHQGAITVFSEPNKGTLFHIHLPLAAPVANQVKPRKPTPKTNHGKGRIMLVDDEEIIRTTTKALLEEFGYQVVVAHNGEEAMVIFKREKDAIDLVLLDLVMPQMNGQQVYLEMIRIDPQVKVIFSSGYAQDVDLEELDSDNYKGFLHKPYRQTELSQIIAETLSP